MLIEKPGYQETQDRLVLLFSSSFTGQNLALHYINSNVPFVSTIPPQFLPQSIFYRTFTYTL